MIKFSFKINYINATVGVALLLHVLFFITTLKEYLEIKKTYNTITEKIEQLDSTTLQFEMKEMLLVSRNSKTIDKTIESLTQKKNNRYLFAPKSKKRIRKIYPKKKAAVIKRSKRRGRASYMEAEAVNSNIVIPIPIDLVFPIKKGNFWISSKFAPRYNKRKGVYEFHYGTDLAANKGTPVYPAAIGEVVFATWHKGFGKCIIIDHGNNIKTRYAHLSKINVRVGEKVTLKRCIGLVGATGNVRGANGGGGYHLHIEVYIGKKRVDPLHYLHH